MSPRNRDSLSRTGNTELGDPPNPAESPFRPRRPSSLVTDTLRPGSRETGPGRCPKRLERTPVTGAPSPRRSTQVLVSTPHPPRRGLRDHPFVTTTKVLLVSGSSSPGTRPTSSRYTESKERTTGPWTLSDQYPHTPDYLCLSTRTRPHYLLNRLPWGVKSGLCHIYASGPSPLPVDGRERHLWDSVSECEPGPRPPCRST